MRVESSEPSPLLLLSVLSRPNEFWSPVSYSLVNIARELVDWSQDPRRYQAGHVADDWDALRLELNRTVQGLCPNIARYCHKETSRLQTSLKNARFGRAVEFATQRPEITEAAVALLDALRRPPAIAASWRDLVDVTSNATPHYLHVATSRDLLLKVLALNGWDVRSERALSLVEGVLRNIKHEVEVARALVEGADVPRLQSRDDLNLRSDSGINARCDLIERYLLRDSPSGEVAVWLSYDKAAVGSSDAQILGPVHLMEASWLRSALDYNPSLVPNEAVGSAKEVRRYIEPVEGERATAYARVLLGQRAVAGSVEDAVKLSELALRLALGMVNRPGWKYNGSYLVFVDGRLERSNRKLLSDDDSRDLGWERRGIDAREVASRLGAELSPDARDSALFEVADSLQAIEATRNAAPFARMALAVQAIERLDASTTQLGAWRAFCVQELRSEWTINTLINNLIWSVLKCCESAQDAHLRLGASRGDLELVRQELDDYSDTQVPIFTAQGVMAASKRLEHLLAPDYIWNIRRRWYSRLFSKSKAGSIVNSGLDQFDLAMKWTERSRNSAVHGGPVSEHTVSAAAQFVETLASIALGNRATLLLALTAPPSKLSPDARLELLRAGELREAWNGP